jgi:hypothetical protein
MTQKIAELKSGPSHETRITKYEDNHEKITK